MVHVVQRGQTLWSIARSYGSSVEQLAALNGLADVNRLEVGQELWVPGPVSRRLLAWPVHPGEILSRFGAPRGGRRHAGIDIRGRPGDPVRAAAAGRVTFSGSKRGYGRTVIVDHGDGIQTLYAHNRDLLVAAGDAIARGERIATVGRSGNATTEHCHFEVRRQGVAVDPVPYLTRAAGADRR